MRHLQVMEGLSNPFPSLLIFPAILSRFLARVKFLRFNPGIFYAPSEKKMPGQE